MKKTSVDRREFLVIGAAAAAGIAAGPLAIGRTRAVGKGEPIAPILAIGFAAAGTSAVVPVGTMRSAAFDTSGSLRVTVQGLRESVGVAKNAVRLTAFFDAEGQSLPFYTWTGESSRTRFTIGAGSPISIGIDRTFAARGVSGFAGETVPDVESMAKKGGIFTLGDDVALGHGTYVVALRRTAVDAVPDWGALSLDQDAEGSGLILRRSETPVSFDHLLLTVENA